MPGGGGGVVVIVYVKPCSDTIYFIWLNRRINCVSFSLNISLSLKPVLNEISGWGGIGWGWVGWGVGLYI